MNGEGRPGGNTTKATNERTCPECGTEFYARDDARYCTSRCRQRAYDRRGQRAAK